MHDGRKEERMRKTKRERRERTDNWEKIQHWFKCPEQNLYERIHLFLLI